MFNVNMLKLTKRSESSGINFNYVILYIGFFINFSVFIYLLQKNYSKIEGIKYWLLILLGLIICYAVRHIFLYLLGRVFPIEKEAALYNYTILVFNILLGVSIIPVNLLLAYGPTDMSLTILYVGIGLVALFYILRNVRALSISLFLIDRGIIPFFIYLCVAEISPILFLYKLVSNWIGL
jgi:hypothetical protein